MKRTCCSGIVPFLDCKCCVYGPVVTCVPIIFAFAAVLMTGIFAMGCELFESEFEYKRSWDMHQERSITRGYGPWRIQGFELTASSPNNNNNNNKSVSSNSDSNNNNNSTNNDLDLDMYWAYISVIFGNVTTTTNSAAGAENKKLSKSIQKKLKQENVTISAKSVCYHWGKAMPSLSSFSMMYDDSTTTSSSKNEDDGNDEMMGSYEFDKPMKMARFFSMLSMVLSIIAFLLLLSPVCCTFGNQSKFVFCFFGCLSFSVGISSIATLVGLRSELCTGAVSCRIGWTGVLCIMSSILWFIVGCGVLNLFGQTLLDNRWRYGGNAIIVKKSTSTSPTAGDLMTRQQEMTEIVEQNMEP